MCIRNTIKTYGVAAKTFHWLIFLLIATLIAVGFIMEDMPNGPDKFRLIGLHKSIGITVLCLAVLRLGWRWIGVVPALPLHMDKWAKAAAHGFHYLLYICMLAMPLSGWAMSSAAGYKVSVFGLFTLPDILAPDRDLKILLIKTHEVLAWTIIVLVSLHIAAALLHHFYYKDNILRRMLPFVKPESDHARDDTMVGC